MYTSFVMEFEICRQYGKVLSLAMDNILNDLFVSILSQLSNIFIKDSEKLVGIPTAHSSAHTIYNIIEHFYALHVSPWTFQSFSVAGKPGKL